MRTRIKHLLLILLLGTVCLGLAVDSANAEDGVWSSPVNLSHTPIGSYCPRLVVDGQGTLHAIWQDWVDTIPHQPYILYAQKPRGSAWSSWTYLPNKVQGTCPAMVLGSDGSLHIVISLPDGVGYIRRYADGSWSTLVNLSSTGKNPDVAVALDGAVHVAFEDPSSKLIYHRRKPLAGSWSAPVLVSTGGGSYTTPLIAADTGGTVHLLWFNWDPNVAGFHYAYLEPGGTWSDPEAGPGYPTPWNSVEQFASDSRGKVHLIWAQWDTSTWPYVCQVNYVAKSGAGPWLDGETLSEECANRTALTVDRRGLAYAVWNVYGTLWYATQGPKEWGDPTQVEVDPSFTSQDSSLSLAADRYGDRHLAWDFEQVAGEVWSSSITGWPAVKATITVAGGTLQSAAGDVGLTFPAGAVAEDTIVTHTPNASLASGVLVPLRSFDLSAELASDGTPVTSFAVPYSLTFDYLDEERGMLAEDTLALYWWDGDEWLLEPSSSADPAENRITASLDHMTQFAILGETRRLFLPLVLKGYRP